jgi:hypothetical protein
LKNGGDVQHRFFAANLARSGLRRNRLRHAVRKIAQEVPDFPAHRTPEHPLLGNREIDTDNIRHEALRLTRRLAGCAFSVALRWP